MKADNQLKKSELEYVKNFFVQNFNINYAQDRFRIFKEIINSIDKFLIEKNDILLIIKKNNILKNKYDSFCSLIVGSKIYSGAGILSMNAALKGGASYVQVLVPDKISDLYKKGSTGGLGCFTPDNFPIFDTFRENVHIIADSNHGYKMIGVGKLVADEVLGEKSKLLEPFRYSRFVEGKLHPVSNSPFPWS